VEPEPSKVEARPPALIDGVVRRLFPPVAREATVGDLWERYRSPLQYAAEAFRVLPFVVGSQIRRTSNLPIMGLQAFILFACFDGFEPVQRSIPLYATVAVPTLAAFAGLMMRDVYRTTDRRSIRRAVLDAVTAALCMLLCEAVIAGLVAAGHLSPDWVLPGRLAIVGAMGLPILGVLRMGTAVISDPGVVGRELSAADIAREYQQFQRRARWRNRAEVGAGILSIGTGIFILWTFRPSVAPLGWIFLGSFACIVAFLVAKGTPPPIPPAIDFASSQLLYMRQLARQHQLRRFMWWWYFVPVFLGLTIHLVARGMKTSQPVFTMLGVVLAVLLGFCISGLNRDRGRNVKDKIGRLAAARERPPS
jgi:hypothetical protein